MEKIVTMKSDTGLDLDDSRRAAERSGLNCADLPQTRLPDRQDTDMLLSQKTTDNSSALTYRRSCLSGVQVRHKRQVLQDMARPLKHWLYKHRENPYPTKTEKVLLALGSQMTLVQVSNWFANARRRLKNTVREPDLSWALRIKLYNKYIQGAAERLSASSDSKDSDYEESPQTSTSQLNFGRSSSLQRGKQSSVLTFADFTDDNTSSPPSKYKSSLLNRYLNDTLRHVKAAEADGVSSARNRRSHPESLSSNGCERDVVSPASSLETEANFMYHMDSTDYGSTRVNIKQNPQRPEHQNWREIHAAMALTSLAQDKTCTANRSFTWKPLSTSGTTLTSRMTVTEPEQTTETTLTSRVIQKSSHISEIQTIKVVQINSG
ncbi:homeobox protein Mohawk [Nothobranchius furzeri]|uniref:Homeobox protein Mohawk-like n=1 Tax=Nothobranchius furzeri TaxID=105023 RepID=A0A8C6LEX9_NOTFU|nr:homeobox protein Mohawk [Nothobranchius furzeri]KAF7223041.1 homeobox protein Mohawk-like [Nothobranchius furzeri]